MLGSKRQDKYVSNKRMQEDRHNSITSKLKQEFHMKELAKFENKGKGVAETNYIKRRMTELREKHQRDLEMKRIQLRDLLDRENDQYKLEIKNLEDTPEQQREKMVQRVNELRTRKEAERQKEVAEKMERRFREGADELRKVESDFNELKNTHYRNVQMMEKHQQMEQQYEEDMIYAELWRRDAERKEKKEKEELEERRIRNDERNQILNWQREDNIKQKQEELARIEAEKAMLKDTWKAEAHRQKELEQRTLELNKELNKELFEHNIAQRALKDHLINTEKTADKEMINNIVKREQMLDYLEKEAKERQKKETREFLLNSKNRTNEYLTHEAELNRLVHEEMERQHKKQQDQWKKEEDARIKLMYEVYGSMEGDINRRKQLVENEKAEKVVEKEVVTKDVLDYEEENRRRKEEEWRRNKAHQSSIVGQMGDKRDIERRRLQEKMEQEKAEILANAEYMKRVAEEKEKGRKLLDELRRQRPF